MKNDRITLPDSPKQGDVVEWWTMQHHPGSSYVQRHRATYYEEAACVTVRGKDCGRRPTWGKPFDHEWHIETWYEPGDTKTQGGRISTDDLRQCLATGPSGGSVHATWQGARDAAAANMRERAAEFRSMAERLERDATALEKEPTPKACTEGLQ